MNRHRMKESYTTLSKGRIWWSSTSTTPVRFLAGSSTDRA
jgi:hypothetical protein